MEYRRWLRTRATAILPKAAAHAVEPTTPLLIATIWSAAIELSEASNAAAKLLHAITWRVPATKATILVLSPVKPVFSSVKLEYFWIDEAKIRA